MTFSNSFFVTSCKFLEKRVLNLRMLGAFAFIALFVPDVAWNNSRAVIAWEFEILSSVSHSY